MEAKLNGAKKKIKGVIIGDIIYAQTNDSFYVVSVDEVGKIYLHNLKGKNNLFNSEEHKDILSFTNSLNENLSLGLKHFSQLKYYLDITQKEGF